MIRKKKQHGIKLIEQSPENKLLAVNDTEVHPIWEDKDGNCDVVDEGKEHYFSVYVHFLEGGVSCIADCEKKEDAVALADMIKQVASVWTDKVN